VPLEAFQRKFGTYEGSRINQRMLELVLAFLHEYDKHAHAKEAKEIKEAKEPVTK
jgi:hypothetical protein